MPGYKGHLIGGAAAFGILFYCMHTHETTGVTALEWLSFTLAGALFPDIDVKSKGQKYFYWVALLFFLFFIYNEQYKLLAIASILACVPMLVRHRGLFHKIWFVTCAPCFCWFLISLYFPSLAQSLFISTIFFVFGSVSHLFLDVGLRRMFKW